MAPLNQIHRVGHIFLCEIFCIILTITNFNSLLELVHPAKKVKANPIEKWFKIIYSHDFLPLPILAMLCSLVLVRSFSSGFLLEVHSSVESVSKEMAGA